MASHIVRRKFLATLSGAAVAWPLAARAQQRTSKVPRIAGITCMRDAASSYDVFLSYSWCHCPNRPAVDNRA